MNDGLNFGKKTSYTPVQNNNAVAPIINANPSYNGSGNFSAQTGIGVNVNPSSMPNSNFSASVNHNVNIVNRNIGASKPTFGIGANFKF